MRDRLVVKGWKFGDYEDFLNLSPEEKEKVMKKKKEVTEEVKPKKVLNSTDRIKALRLKINKKTGIETAYNLNEENPTDVKDWIPTGSRWLDSITCKGKMGGIPVGKFTEIAGVPSSGKSYMAGQIAVNATKKGFDIVYFDSESAIDSTFLERMGVSLDDFLYVQASSVEFVLQTIEDLLAENENPMLFIWDSLAMTACESDIAGNFDPLSSIAVKPRILSKGFKKLTIPLANHGSSVLILNQLYTNITSNRSEFLTEPFKAAGGLALRHAYSLSIWLTPRRAKSAFILNADEEAIGSEIKAKIEKSRFGTFNRKCNFKILWGTNEIAIQDEESWLEALRGTKYLTANSAWYKLHCRDGTEEQFQSSKWFDKLKDINFRSKVLDCLDDLLIYKREAALEDDSAEESIE